MFSSALVDVQAQRREQLAQADRLQASAAAAANSFADLLVDELNAEVAQVHETQRQIEREARQLRRELTALTTHLGRWSGRSAALVGALKTAGDLQHYAARLAAEATALASVLVPAEPGQGGSSSGGGGGNSSSSCSDHPVSSAGCTGEVAAPAGAAGSGSGLVTGVPTGAALLPPASLPASVSSEATQSVTQHAELRAHATLRRASAPLLRSLAALLCGLRSVVMLDFAPGVAPAALADVLAPLSAAAPSFRGCVLELDGCCYIAHAPMLLERLSALTTADASTLSSAPLLLGMGAPDAAASSSGMGILAGTPAAEAHRQLTALADGLSAALRRACASSDAPSPAAPLHAAWPCVSLSALSSLPALPGLNGVLLGYPAVYWVQDAADGAAAAAALSSTSLTLCRVCVRCSALPGNSGSSSSQVQRGGREDEETLLGFTVPEGLWSAQLEAAARALTDGVVAAAGGSPPAGCLQAVPGDWGQVSLQVQVVSPGPVAL